MRCQRYYDAYDPVYSGQNAMASTEPTVPAKPAALKKRILNDEPVSFTAYLERDAEDKRRLEYYDGWIVNVTGASWHHNVIVSNLHALLSMERSRSGCQALTNDLRVGYGNEERYAYPDLVVCCGAPQLRRHGGVDVLMNPTCIAEVLSPSTADYDRGEKSYRYRQIDALQTYFVIAQHEPQVTLWTRGENISWTLRDISGLDSSFKIEGMNVSIQMRRLYAGVFDAAA